MDMEEVQLDGSSGNSGNTSINTTPILSGSTSTPPNNVNAEFIGQMEQVFKAIDKNSTGVISLSQLRSEIEELGADIDENPLIGQLIQYLRHVHSSNNPLDEDSSSTEEDIWIDFESFVSSMTHFVEGVDPMESRRIREERLKLPRFKVPVDLLKKYSITPKGSPIITPGGSPGFSHTAGFSPAKNKFNKMFSNKPVIPFDQFQQLITKLNYGKEIPKNKLLMFINDLPTDADGCVDINTFLNSYGGLNHPMSPKLIYEESDIKEKAAEQTTQKSTLEWNKNNDLFNQLNENYRVLEKECETFQSEISFLEKSKAQLEAQLRKRDMEIEKLKKETKFIEGMRDTNKELTVQNTTLKTQITKMNTSDALLRDNMEHEKEKLRNVEEQMILKELEIKKLNHQIKTQQNINSKLSMMVSFVNENEKEKDNKPDNASRFSGINKSKTLKITQKEKGAKPTLLKQKSDFFDAPVKSSSPTMESTSPNISIENLRSSLQAVSLQREFELVKREQEESNTELDELKLQVQSFGEELSLSSFQPTVESESISETNTTSTPIENSSTQHTETTNSTSTTASVTPSNVSTPPVALTMVTPNNPTSTLQSSNNNNNTSQSEKPTPIIEPPSPIVIQSPTNNTPLRLSSPLIQTPPSNSPRTILTSPGYVRQSSPAITDRSSMLINSASHQSSPSIATSSPLSTSSSSNNIGLPPPLTTTLELPTLSPTNLQSNPNVGSIKRMKKSDLIRLQMSELEAHKESAQNLIDETTAALSNLYKNKDNELQRVQKMYNEEKQANKYLEKQLSTQLEKNKELIAGKEKNSWGGMQSFFSFVSHFLPSSLLCNVSGTS